MILESCRYEVYSVRYRPYLDGDLQKVVSEAN